MNTKLQKIEQVIIPKYENGNLMFVLEKNIKWDIENMKISFSIYDSSFECPIKLCCSDYAFHIWKGKYTIFNEDYKFNIKLDIKIQIENVKIFIDKVLEISDN